MFLKARYTCTWTPGSSKANRARPPRLLHPYGRSELLLLLLWLPEPSLLLGQCSSIGQRVPSSETPAILWFIHKHEKYGTGVRCRDWTATQRQTETKETQMPHNSETCPGLMGPRPSGRQLPWDWLTLTLQAGPGSVCHTKWKTWWTWGFFASLWTCNSTAAP